MSNSFSILLSDYPLSEIELPESTKTFEKFGNHKIWGESDIVPFLYSNFPVEILQAYTSLKPYAYKADLASYCILYQLGGWYTAISNTIIEIPNTSNLDFLFFDDSGPTNSFKTQHIACQMLYTKPKNIIFLDAIMSIIKNVHNKHYGENPLCITGPYVLGRSFEKYKENQKYKLGEFDSIKYRTPVEFILDEKTVAIYKKEFGGILNIKGTNNYNDFWNNKDVYK